MQKKTEDVAACVYLEVIYVSLYLHDLVMILSTKRKKKKKQVYPESWLLQLLQVLNISQSLTVFFPI